ncbi:MAG: hemolysin family protein [Actinomycetia bacterium]|nr:hemolysin family protein [Actinomycetes bacterium]
MTGIDIGLLIALAAMIGAAAILGAAEAALLRVQRVRLEVTAESGDARSLTMLSLLDDLPRVLNSVLLAVLLVQIGAATIAGAVASRFFGSLGVTIASVVLTFVLFVYTEAIPKTYAVGHPEAVARMTAPLLRVLAWILRPFVSLLVRFADLQAPGTGIAAPTAPTEQELLRLASDAAAFGTIEESDHMLIDRAFEVGDLRVDDIYVPRLDVVAVPQATSVRDALDTAIATGHRSLPTYENDIDNIVGIVGLADLARARIADALQPVAALAHEPLVVPESRMIIDLVRDMKKRNVRFAVVVDEYGGTAGIVTVEDVADRLIGPLLSTGRHATADIEHTNDGIWVSAGTADTDDLERVLGVSLPQGEWNTVAGLVIGVAGRIPDEGESVDIEGFRFTVLEARSRRVLSVEITQLRSE